MELSNDMDDMNGTDIRDIIGSQNRLVGKEVNVVLTEGFLYDGQLNPVAPACFVFRNKRADKVKLIWWERNGFWLAYKRLEQDRFVWPRGEAAVITLSLQQLQWLLAGFDLGAMRGHAPRHYQRAS